jgi:hypothetical protein
MITYLIRSDEHIKFIVGCESPYNLILEVDPIVCISDPYDIT